MLSRLRKLVGEAAAVARAMLEPDRPVHEHPCSMRPPRPGATAATVGHIFARHYVDYANLRKDDASPGFAFVSPSLVREMRDILGVLVRTDPGGFADPDRQHALRRARELVGP